MSWLKGIKGEVNAKLITETHYPSEVITMYTKWPTLARLCSLENFFGLYLITHRISVCYIRIYALIEDGVIKHIKQDKGN